MGILRVIKAESTPAREAYAQVKALFADTPSLVEGFEEFLPVEVQQEIRTAREQEGQAEQKRASSNR